jgi:hypothetical protein
MFLIKLFLINLEQRPDHMHQLRQLHIQLRSRIVWSVSLLNVGKDGPDDDRFDGQFVMDTLGDRVSVG